MFTKQMRLFKTFQNKRIAQVGQWICHLRAMISKSSNETPEAILMRKWLLLLVSQTLDGADKCSLIVFGCIYGSPHFVRTYCDLVHS